MRVDDERKSVDIERRDINYILPAYIRLYLFQTKNQDPEVITFPMFESVPHPYKKGVMVPIEYVPDTSPIALKIAHDGADIPEATPEVEAAADKAEEDYNTIKAKLEAAEAELAKLKDGEPVESEPEPESNAQNAQGAQESQESPTAVSPAKAAFAEQAGESIHEVEKERYEAKDQQIQEANLLVKSTEQEAKEAESAIAGMGEQPTPERLAKAKEAPGGTLPPGTPTDYGGKRDSRDQKRIAKDIAPHKDIKEENEIEIGSIEEIKEPEKKES